MSISMKCIFWQILNEIKKKQKTKTFFYKNKGNFKKKIKQKFLHFNVKIFSTYICEMYNLPHIK